MAATVLNQELDPSLAEGIRLLHSSDPDSEDYLYQLWKRCVYEKYGTDRTPTTVLHKIIIPSRLKRESSHELTDDFTLEPKKSKLQSPPLLFQRSAPASPQSAGAGCTYSLPEDIILQDSSSEDDNETNEPPIEMLQGDNVCMKCKLSSFSSGNKFVECVDCHKHYHQQCHFPPVTSMDLSDPRFVWYCSACEQSITTTAAISSDRNKGGSLTANPTKSSSSSSSSKSVNSSPAKSSRSYGSSASGHKTGSSNSKVSTESSPKRSPSSSSSSDKKSSHLMKKRSFKKHDKKKSSK